MYADTLKHPSVKMIIMKAYNNSEKNTKLFNSMRQILQHCQGLTSNMQNGTSYRKSISDLTKIY